MDVQLTLKSLPAIIGSTADFAYKWSRNAGLPPAEATRFALAIDELVTNVVRFAYPDEVGTFDLEFRRQATTVEAILHERGQPFDPLRHPYDPARAAEGDFDGAGLALLRHLADDFLYVNKGRAGKEFRIVQVVPSPHIADVAVEDLCERSPVAAPETPYTVHPMTEDDAEDAARLIYRTYGDSYMKEELYFPRQIALALERQDKFGVMARTPEGEAVGYFAVLRTTDSRIGEVGEAVVAPAHRRRGVMTRMLDALIDEARQRGLLALFGEAVTVHAFSQRANARFGFHSTALLLAAFGVCRYRHLIEDYAQDLSVVIDVLPLQPLGTRTAYLPARYAGLLEELYATLGADLRTAAPAWVPAPRSDLALTLNHEFGHALLVARRYGVDFAASVATTAADLRRQGLRVLYVDLPLDDPGTPHAAETLHAEGFVLAGMMPLFHQERDYLRLQHLGVELDFSAIHVHSGLAHRLKARIAEELGWNIPAPAAASTSASNAISTS
ncbi:MAG: GNAT family N-acetyltransferase [Rhodothermales bacterium]|nr:GNAT family N-acetyltransferase [Rhodothermales bacterium]